ncbi:Uncharacterised protein [Bordetella pertussis]|nr:Uncharacterised protein [Bordetella pertussis]
MLQVFRAGVRHEPSILDASIVVRHRRPGHAVLYALFVCKTRSFT